MSVTRWNDRSYAWIGIAHGNTGKGRGNARIKRDVAGTSGMRVTRGTWKRGCRGKDVGTSGSQVDRWLSNARCARRVRVKYSECASSVMSHMVNVNWKDWNEINNKWQRSKWVRLGRPSRAPGLHYPAILCTLFLYEMLQTNFKQVYYQRIFNVLWHCFYCQVWYISQFWFDLYTLTSK
jgi:hypothetical protein